MIAVVKTQNKHWPLIDLLKPDTQANIYWKNIKWAREEELTGKQTKRD